MEHQHGRMESLAGTMHPAVTKEDRARRPGDPGAVNVRVVAATGQRHLALQLCSRPKARPKVQTRFAPQGRSVPGTQAEPR
jgi:hypothetical protein